MEQQEEKPLYKKWWFIALAVLFGLGLIGLMSDTSSNTSTTSQAGQDSNVQPSQEQYVEIFKFSGNGAKKSEPFTITGSRFKIAYDCKGDPNATLCTAFVFRVGSQLPQGVMNATQAVKDETIIYSSMAGKGEYYIDANVLGNFTMTVYDYR